MGMNSYFHRGHVHTQYVARIHKHDSDEIQTKLRSTRRTRFTSPYLGIFSTPLRPHRHIYMPSHTIVRTQNSSFLGLGSPNTGGPPGVELRTTTRSRSRPGLELLLLIPAANGSSVGAAIGAMRKTLAGGRPTNRWSDHGSSYCASIASAT